MSGWAICLSYPSRPIRFFLKSCQSQSAVTGNHVVHWETLSSLFFCCYSFNVRMPSSSDRIAAVAASVLISWAAEIVYGSESLHPPVVFSEHHGAVASCFHHNFTSLKPPASLYENEGNRLCNPWEIKTDWKHFLFVVGKMDENWNLSNTAAGLLWHWIEENTLSQPDKSVHTESNINADDGRRHAQNWIWMILPWNGYCICFNVLAMYNKHEVWDVICSRDTQHTSFGAAKPFSERTWKTAESWKMPYSFSFGLGSLLKSRFWSWLSCFPLYDLANKPVCKLIRHKLRSSWQHRQAL